VSLLIYLDLDEVLADFLGGVCRAFETSRADVEAHWQPGVWGIEAPLSKATNRKALTSGDVWGSRQQYRKLLGPTCDRCRGCTT
jgi:hypothetical protein